MLKVGIVGLPNVGKSTLFNALLKKRVALSANYPFATVEPNVGVVAVPDERLEKLAELVARSTSGESEPTPEVSKKPPIVPAVVQFVDIAGLVRGAHKGEGLGNQFLSHIREVDAIVHVLRDFEDESVIKAGSENPKSDRQTVETELALADLGTLEKLIANLEREVKVARDPFEAQKLQILKSIRQAQDRQVQDDTGRNIQDDTGTGQDVRAMQHDVGHGSVNGLKTDKVLSKNQAENERLKRWFRSLPLLTIKPVLYVLNVGDQEYAARIGDPSTNVRGDQVVVCAKLEEELADFSEEERMAYLKSVGVEQTGLERLIQKAYHLLGLISFLTAGIKEVRAWTLRRGETALRASGIIHTDFMKKFIKVEVIPYEKLIEAGSYAQAKQKGWIRTEGKDYEIKDGDVVEFMIGN